MAILRPTEPIFRQPIRRGQVALGAQSGASPFSCPFHAIVTGGGTTRGNDMVISGTSLYVCHQGLSTITAYDVSSPGSPTVLGTSPSGGGFDMAVGPGYACVSPGGTATFRVYDISDPTDMTIADTWTYPASAAEMYGVALKDGVAFVGANALTSGFPRYLKAFDVSVPTAIEEISQIDLMPFITYIQRIAIIGSHAFIPVGEANTMSVVDITDPSSMSIVAEETIPIGPISDVATAGNTLFLLDFDGSLVAVDVSDPESPTVIDELAGFTNPTYLDVAGGRAVVTDTTSQLLIDISDPSAMSIIGSVSHGTTITFQGACAISGDWTYVYDHDSPAELVVIHASCYQPPV